MTDTIGVDGGFSVRVFPAMRADVAPASDLPRAPARQGGSTILWAVTAVLSTAGLLIRESAQGMGLTGMAITVIGVLIAAGAGLIVTATTLVRRADRIAADNARAEVAWRWPACTFLGPFDKEHGIRGAHIVHDLHQRVRAPSDVSLRVQGGNIEVVSTTLLAAAPGRGIGIPISELAVVDIVAGATPRSWLTAVRRREGWRRGQVRFVTKDGHRADFTGVRVDHLASHLERVGGQRLSGGWG